VHVIARAHAGSVLVGEVLGALGGGGHEGAASAVVRGETLNDVVARLRTALERRSLQPLVVRDLMSSPVRTVTPDTPLMELASSLAEWQHTGAPVLQDGSIVGIVSRRDIERARRDGQCDLAVKSRMTHRVHTIGPQNTLTEALDRMKQHNVGRLPVVDDGRVVGIISRRDLLRHLYETSAG
jgi:tRNA nucleotidyltransferase (CCA-adding enzyme)